MKTLDEMSINTIRFLAVDAVEAAQSGHPGLPMGGAAMAYTLWSRFLKHDPQDQKWPDRDRFVLSAGHGSMLLYALLHLSGYDVSLEDIKKFRQWGSKTPGHPEYGHTPGVETTTGPLGQGFANAVGMAIAEKKLAAEFNRPGYSIVDHNTYVYTGDGCMMEGITSEAASLAGHLRLGKLICLYDDNQITIDGKTEITFTENVGMRFEAYGWQVIRVPEGNDVEKITRAIEEARQEKERPTLIMVRTVIGFGSPGKAGSSEVHGAPLGAEETARTKKNLGWPQEQLFFVPDEVKKHFEEIGKKNAIARQAWQQLMGSFQKEYPELAARWQEWMTGSVPMGLENEPELWKFDKPMATRDASGQIMQVLSHYLPNMMGGSADLNASTKTYLENRGDFQHDNPAGSNIYFGIREHAMGAILSGIALHGGLRPFGSTFLAFYDYMKPAVRMASLMGLPVVLVYTHDSIALGEDGPTHQPVEQLANLRSVPGLRVLRPADGKETAAAWLVAVTNAAGPTVLVLSRQKLPQLRGTGKEAARGGYIVSREDRGNPDIILLASGSELSLVMEASVELRKKGVSVRVVSMMSWELFRKQEKNYKDDVLPPGIKNRLAVEAAHPMGWLEFVGSEGVVLGVERFGSSAPGQIVMEKMGFTVENILKLSREMLKK
ncbi:transketolase [Parasporobacterium paucivorans]|uniref:Transketolase n=1 Tax=Parasporobacterium paucivorans DSM 15970 TaxID=1122934 RepID=A0A1M6CXJ9_9FIRM|nr:transketolase [Parasporobacterium paucivorans]SHI65571.1 transketolase [Parasporobacterium paucivorans DSM 15970]